MTNLNSPPLIYVEVSGFREEVSIMRGGGGHLCVYKLPLKPVIGLKITHSALHFNATRRASSPATSVCPRSCKCTLSDFWPSLFYIKMSRKWKLSSGNFFNLCAQIKVMAPGPVVAARKRCSYLTQYDADVCGSICARGIMPHQSINLQ